MNTFSMFFLVFGKLTVFLAPILLGAFLRLFVRKMRVDILALTCGLPFFIPFIVIAYTSEILQMAYIFSLKGYAISGAWATGVVTVTIIITQYLPLLLGSYISTRYGIKKVDNYIEKKNKTIASG